MYFPHLLIYPRRLQVSSHPLIVGNFDKTEKRKSEFKLPFTIIPTRQPD